MTPAGATAERRNLSFATETDSAGDVNHLKLECQLMGNRSFPQVCHHLRNLAPA